MFKPMEHLCRNSRTHLFFSMMLYCTRGNPFTAAGCSLVMSHLSFLSFCSCKREWSLRFTRTVYAWLDVRTLSSKEETEEQRSAFLPASISAYTCETGDSLGDNQRPSGTYFTQCCHCQWELSVGSSWQWWRKSLKRQHSHGLER